ncbi:MAG: TonB-dependent receptor, partial [candidate division NC10 bacterium]|nr:TonB-dependent receptor [candidate division NC10 bacterium]
ATDDATAGSSRGRTDLAPDNSAHTIRLSGAATLPVGFPARFAGTFSYGMRFQDDPFVPHTINSASSDPGLALPAASLDGEVRTLLANLVLTGRPWRDLNLTARYRFYDYNSDIPILTFPAHVINDRSLETVNATRFNTPIDHRTHNASLDASYRLARPATLKVGYERERWDRSDHREVTRTDEHAAKAAVDYKPAPWALLRAGYRFGIRRGSDYNTFAHLEHAVLEDEVLAAMLQGQSTFLRKFDEADRVRHQVDLLAQASPQEDLTLTFTGGYGLINYDESTFGLTDDERWSVGPGTPSRTSSSSRNPADGPSGRSAPASPQTTGRAPRRTRSTRREPGRTWFSSRTASTPASPMSLRWPRRRPAPLAAAPAPPWTSRTSRIPCKHSSLLSGIIC